MSFINYANREITFRIAYWGPAYSGKGTNLRHIGTKLAKSHSHLSDVYIAEPIGDDDDELQPWTPWITNLVFDSSIGPNVQGLATVLHLVGISGMTFSQEWRRRVLAGVDGVVFVADSSHERRESNRESLALMSRLLEECGAQLDSVVVCVQYNKRDLPNALAIDELRADLNSNGRWAEQEACASSGTGVLQTLHKLIRDLETKQSL